MLLQLADQCFQQLRLCHVVTLSYPDVFTLGKADATLPLDECVARIMFVDNDMSHMRIAAVLLDDLYDVIWRAVIKNDDLKILIGLVQYAVDALLQIGRMVLVGIDDAYGRSHGVLYYWCITSSNKRPAWSKRNWCLYSLA